MAYHLNMQIIKNGPLLLLWLTLTSTAPFIFYSWPGHPYKILTFTCLLIMLFQMTMKWKRKIFDVKILLIVLMQIAYYILMTFYHNDLSHLNLCIQLISLFIIISYINGFIGFRLFVKSYIYIILAMGIGGTIIFFLHALIGINPLLIVDYSETGTSYFLGLTTTNVYYNLSDLRLIRYSGFFDEPGTFALFSIFAIILNKIYFKNNRVELWLIIVTMFTMSLAFYFVIFIYFILFYINKANLKYLIIILITIYFSFNYISNNKTNGTLSKLYDFTFSRLDLNNENGLIENNRVDKSEHDKEIFFKSPFLGVGSAKKEVIGSNLFSIFAQYGIIGSAFYYAFLVYFSLQIIMMKRKHRWFYLKILLLILLNFYHRPELSSVFSLLVFVSIIYYIKNESLLQESIQEMEENRTKLVYS